MERVIDRSELLSEASSDPPSPSGEVLEQFGHLSEFEYVRVNSPADVESKLVQEADDEDAVDFNLFAAPTSTTTTQPAKIRLQSPSIENKAPGFLVPGRDPSYYFSDPLTALQLRDIGDAAVTGEQILARARSAQPGCSYPWKVLHVPTTRNQARLTAHADVLYQRLSGIGSLAVARHKRPGKKARVKTRTKLAAVKAKQEVATKEAELKAAAEREKRTLKNRTKKAKKRQRDKAKKASDPAAEPADSSASEAGE